MSKLIKTTLGNLRQSIIKRMFEIMKSPEECKLLATCAGIADGNVVERKLRTQRLHLSFGDGRSEATIRFEDSQAWRWNAVPLDTLMTKVALKKGATERAVLDEEEKVKGALDLLERSERNQQWFKKLPKRIRDAASKLKDDGKGQPV